MDFKKSLHYHLVPRIISHIHKYAIMIQQFYMKQKLSLCIFCYLESVIDYTNITFDTNKVINFWRNLLYTSLTIKPGIKMQEDPRFYDMIHFYVKTKWNIMSKYWQKRIWIFFIQRVSIIHLSIGFIVRRKKPCYWNFQWMDIWPKLFMVSLNYSWKYWMVLWKWPS